MRVARMIARTAHASPRDLDDRGRVIAVQLGRSSEAHQPCYDCRQ